MPPKELSLNPLWKSLGADFKEERGWIFPISFGNPEKELSAAKNGVGLIDYSYRGRLIVTGRDQIQVLHNVLTQDIKNIPINGGAQSALLTATGKIIGIMDVYRFSESVWLETEINFEEILAQALNKFVITEDVAIESISNQYIHLFITGPKSKGLLMSILNVYDLPEKNMENRTLNFGSSKLICTYRLQNSFSGFDLHIESQKSSQLVQEMFIKGENFGLCPVGYNAAEILRKEAGILRFGIDFDNTVILNETGLEDKLVSWTKGCYPGQEVVARYKTYKGSKRF